jgi:hypothetical protein
MQGSGLGTVEGNAATGVKERGNSRGTCTTVSSRNRDFQNVKQQCLLISLYNYNYLKVKNKTVKKACR